MPRACSVCARDDRAAIDAALARLESNRQVSAQYGLSEQAVRRHVSNHVAGAVAQAQDAQDIARGLDVLEQLRAINTASLVVLRDARVSHDGRLVLLAVDRVQRQLELQARILGDLVEPTTTINVAFETEWPALRWRIVQALDPFPDARLSVLSVLASANGKTNGRAH